MHSSYSWHFSTWKTKILHIKGLKCIPSNGRVAAKPDLHMARQAIVHNQAVRHLHPVGLHGVPSPIVVVSYLGVIEVGHLKIRQRRS